MSKKRFRGRVWKWAIMLAFLFPSQAARAQQSSPMLSAANFSEVPATARDGLEADSPSLSTVHVGEPIARKTEPLPAVEDLPSRRKWILLSLAQHSAAAFDAYTTRQAISRGAAEGDPLMRPFAGSPALYAAMQVGPVALDFAARRMQRAHNSLIRRMWWLPQTTSTAMFLFSGAHNLGVPGRP